MYCPLLICIWQAVKRCVPFLIAIFDTICTHLKVTFNSRIGWLGLFRRPRFDFRPDFQLVWKKCFFYATLRLRTQGGQGSLEARDGQKEVKPQVCVKCHRTAVEKRNLACHALYHSFHARRPAASSPR
jgi:hypothetical protein